MTNPQQHAGIFDEEEKKREVRAGIESFLEGNEVFTEEEKGDLLVKLNRFNLEELERTRMELLRDGKALMEDQKKQEDAKD